MVFTDQNDEGGNALRKLGYVAGAIGAGVVALTIGIGSFFTYIPPTHTAVKQSKYGEGIEQKVYPGGEYYFEGLGVSFMKFPKQWQVIDYNGNDANEAMEREIEGFLHEPKLEISCADGFKNDFEITVQYRITDPLKVIAQIGKGGTGLYQDYVNQNARTLLEKALRALKADDLYDVEKRKPAAEEGQHLLNDKLAPVGIEVGEVRIRNFKYNPDYEGKINAKVLQEQLTVTNREQATAAEKQALVKKINAEGQAAVDVEIQRAKNEVTRRTAEGESYDRIQRAEGDRITKKAEAEGQVLVNKAYEGTGSERIVGLEMAKKKAQAMKQVYITSCDENPLDMREVLRGLTGR